MKKRHLAAALCALAVPFLCAACSGGSSSDGGSTSMELEFRFSGESAARATVVYGASGGGGSSAEVSSAVSGNRAVFSLSGGYANSSGWLEIRVLKVYAESGSLLSASTSDTKYFAFKEDSTYTMSYTLSQIAPAESVSIPALSVALPSDFVRGFDASEVDFYETEHKLTWSDSGGTQKDFFEILAENGVNTVRLRIWNDPSQFSSSLNTGMNDLERTVRMAKRVKAAGLDLMLDFHYSDTWADPGRQIVPAAWAELGSVESIAKALGEYTTNVLTSLREQAGIVPKYVQVGNEINSGIMIHKSAGDKDNNNKHTDFALGGNSWETGNDDFYPENLIAYLNAGGEAVRAFDPGIKIVLHVAGADDLRWFFDPLEAGGVPFDVVGLSYYPWESGHGTISELRDCIEDVRSRYGVDVLVAECSAHWKDNKDTTEQGYSYTHLKDPATSAVYADLDCGANYVKGTVQNQASIIRHIIEESAGAGGTGVFAWGGDLYGNIKWGMFDENGFALPSLAVFAVQGSDEET